MPTRNLSPRERDCLLAVHRGLNSPEIAHELGISEGTVNGYIASAVRKMGGINRRRAAFLLAQDEQRYPEKIEGEILLVDDEAAVAPPTPGSAVHDDAVSSTAPAQPTAASGDDIVKGNGNDHLIQPMRTIAFIVAIAAGLALLIVALPSIFSNAKAIANAIQPPN